MNMFRFASRFLIAFALAIPTAHGQTPQSYNTVASIAALKAMTNRPQVVQVTGTNAGTFNLNAGACAAADDLMQVQPTSGTMVCYVRAANINQIGKSATSSGVVVTDGAGMPSVATTLPSGLTIPFTQSGTGAVPTTQAARNAGYLTDAEYGTQAQAYNQATATGVPLLQVPSVNVGNECGYPVSTDPCVGGSAAHGFMLGHSTIGNGVLGTNAFVGLQGDEYYTNVNQEARGISYTVRNTRTTPDEPTRGWDFFGIAGNVVVEAGNTQNLVGNHKAVVGELYYKAPTTGSYSVLTSHNFQATIPELGTGVTLDKWYGLVVNSPPLGGGAITTGYGVYIQDISLPSTKAAIKMDGTGLGGQIKWTGTSITEDSGGKMEFNFNGQMQSIVGPATGTTVGAAGAASALPANPSFYLRILVGGVEYRTPFYAAP